MWTVASFPAPWLAAAVGVCSVIAALGVALWALRALRGTRIDLQGKVDECLAARAETAAEREQLRITLSCIGDGVIVCDRDGRVQLLNGVAERLTGWAQQDGVGQSMATVFAIADEHSGATVDNPALRALRDRTTVGLADRTALRSRDGATVPITHSAAPIVDAAGAQVGAVLVFRDAAAQRAVERKLTEAHEALQVVVQSSPLAVVVTDPCEPGHPDHLGTGRVRLWNGAAERVFGWTAQEVLDGPLPIVPAELADEARRIDEQVRAGSTLAEVETFRRRADGTQVDVRLSAAPMRDAEGAVTGILMLFADITDRVRAEVSLRQSEATLRAVFDNAPFCLGVVELTPEGDILHLDDNPRTGTLFGVPAGRMTGCRAGELGMPDALIAMWRERYLESSSIDGPVEFQYTQRSTGEAGTDVQRPIRAIVCPIGWGPSGRVRYCYIAEDITQRRAAETRLTDSEASARLALQVARLGAWRWDAHTGEFTADARLREICGLDRQARLGRRELLRCVHPDDRPRVKRALVDATSGDTDDGRTGEYGQQFRLLHPDGEVRWVVARGQVLSDGDPAAPDGAPADAASADATPATQRGPRAARPLRMVGSLFDITERRRNEETLALADRRKDEFLATLAHELRNPLAPLRNGVHLLRNLLHDTPAATRPLVIMERQIGHMVRLIDDLLDVARVSGGKLHLQCHRVDIAQLVREAVDASQSALDAAGHRLVVVLPEQPVLVDADPTRLCQVLANLLNNAAKYMPAPGLVRISVEPRSAGMQEGDDGSDGGNRASSVDVSVEDNGLGIPAEMLPRIFDMFTQVDQTLDRAQGGLGIGLSIARRLIEMHGGRLRAYSAGAGSGSRFVVSLPIAHVEPIEPGETIEQRELTKLNGATSATSATGSDTPTTAAQDRQAAQTLQSDTASPPPAPRRRILVADDNTDSADSLVALLGLMGHDARVARDGLQAYEVAQTFAPELALLDIGMPKLNGYELARRLREMPWGRTIRLVAVTGWGQDADRRLSEAAGFDLHLVKPVDPAALQALVDGELIAP